MAYDDTRPPQPPSGELARELEAMVATINGPKTSFELRDIGAWVVHNSDRILTSLTASDTRLRALEKAERRAVAIIEACHLDDDTAANNIACDLRDETRAALQDTASPPNGGEGK